MTSERRRFDRSGRSTGAAGAVGTRSRRSGRRRTWIHASWVTGALLVGCGGPFLLIPGGALSGEVVSEPVDDWSFVDARFVDLETRPEDPYSVELNYFVRDGRLYLDPAEGRRWLDHIRADPRVRVRFDGRIYPLRAVLVGRPGEIEGFDPDRFVYRLDPR